jgi:hypothetical protein
VVVVVDEEEVEGEENTHEKKRKIYKFSTE